MPTWSGSVPSGKVRALLSPAFAQDFTTSFDVGSKTFTRVFVFLLAVSASAQSLLYLSGLYSVSYNESTRALVAHDLSWNKVIALGIWPPFTKILMGLPLKLHNDLFLTPRVEIGVVGLICLGAIAFLTWRLFNNRLMCLVAVALALFLPQRLILSVVPLSDMFGYVLILFAAGFTVGWMRHRRMSELTAASVFIMLASGVRLEDWFINAVFGLYLAYSALVRREMGFGIFLLNGTLIAIFPTLWMANFYLRLGSLHDLFATSNQFLDYYGRDYVYALKANVLYRLIRDIIYGPAIAIGALSLLRWTVRDRTIRAWAVIFFLPVVIEAIIMIVTFSVPIGEGQRIDGLSVLLLVPFAAYAIIVIVGRIVETPLARFATIAVTVGALAIPFALRTHLQIKMFSDIGVSLDAEDVAVGRYLRDLFRRDSHAVLLDAISNLDYQNIMVTANAPERFILNVDADPVRTAFFADMREIYLKRQDTQIINTYLTDKFWQTDGPDLSKLHARNIGYILAHNGDYIRALDASGKVKPVTRFSRWTLFALADSKADVTENFQIANPAVSQP